MSTLALIVLAGLLGALIALATIRVRRSRHDLTPSPRRILFPFVGNALSEPALDAALRIARAEGATLVPAYLASVSLDLPLESALPKACDEAMPLLEAIEQRATLAGVAVDARIERGRSHRHALRQLIDHERYDRVVIAASGHGVPGFSAADIAWLLEQVPGEILVLRPASDARLHPRLRALESGRGWHRQPAGRPR